MHPRRLQRLGSCQYLDFKVVCGARLTIKAVQVDVQDHPRGSHSTAAASARGTPGSSSGGPQKLMGTSPLQVSWRKSPCDLICSLTLVPEAEQQNHLCGMKAL